VRRVKERDRGIPRRLPRPLHAALAAFLAATLLALAACSGPYGGGGAERRVPVTAESGGSASVEGVQVEIAPGAVTGTGTLTLRHAPQETLLPTDLPQGMTVLGEGMEATLAGTDLAPQAEAVITIEPPESGAYSDGETAESIYVLLWEDPTTGWTALPTERTRGGAFVARTGHFSWGFLARFDAREWARQQLAAAGAYFSGRSEVAQPSCGAELPARDAGIEVASDSGDTVRWCFGLEDGRQVLKVANNRRAFTEVAFPQAWEVVDDGAPAASPDALTRSLGDWAGELAEPNRQVRVIDGGGTLTLVVPPRSSGQVTVQPGLPAWALSAIVFGLDVYAFAATSLRIQGVAQSASTLPDRIVDRIVAAEDLGGYAEPLQACGRAFSDEVADGATGDDLTDGVRAIWSCLPALIQADVAEAGITNSGLALALGLLNGTAAHILTAGNLVLSAARDAIDNAATPAAT